MEVEQEGDNDMEMVVRPETVAWNKMKMPFMFLPYRIFAEWTNIAELIKEHEDEDGANPPTDIELEKHIRTIHRELHEINWYLFGLHKLKFTCSPDQKCVSEASIFNYNEVKSLRIYKAATDFQRQFLFLPLSLVMHATNIRDIAIETHIKKFPERAMCEENLIAISEQIHGQIHKLNRWFLGKINDIRFLRPEQKDHSDEAVPVKNERGRPRKNAVKLPPRPAKNLVRDEPQPSTSRAYHEPSTSRVFQQPSTSKANHHPSTVDTTFSNPQMHSTLINPQQSIDPKSKDDDKISKRTHKRACEKASNSAQSSGELAISPKKSKANESNRSSTSDHSSRNESERKKSNTSNHTSMSDTSGTTMHPKKAPQRALKRSQLDLSDKPTKVQRKVIEMDMNCFVAETNIKELIRRKYGKLTNVEHQQKINHYFSLRSEWDAWKQHDCLNDLALKEDLSVFELSNPSQDIVYLVDSDDDANGVTAKKSKISSATKPETSSKLAGSSKNTLKIVSSSQSTVQKSSKPHKRVLTELQSELYKKLSPLSLQEFIEKTNVRQLLQKEIEKSKATPELFEQNMKNNVNKIFKILQRPDKWHNFELMQQLEFVNVESDPTGSSEMNVNNDDAAPFSCQEENNKSVQVEMSPINDDMLSEASEIGGETESMDISPIPISTSTQKVQDTNSNNQETQFDQSDNAENLNQITIQPSNNENIDETTNNGSSTHIKHDPVHILSMSPVNTSDVVCEGTRVSLIIELSDSEDETQETQQSYPAHSQSTHNSSARAASQAERNVDLIESLPVPISMSSEKNYVENSDNPQPHADESHNLELWNNKSTGEPTNNGSTMKIKPEPAQLSPKSQSIDNEVICEGTFIEPTITLRDTDDDLQEMNELLNGTAIMNCDSDSFGFSNKFNNQNVEADNMTAEELITILSEEPPTTENVHTEVVCSTTTITTETIMSVESGSTMRSSPLQRIENIMNAPTSNPRPLTKRPYDKTTTKGNTAKRSKKTMDDTLSNIQPPKYDYPPLQLINKQSNGTVHHTVGQKSTNVHTNDFSIHTDNDVTLSLSPQIDSDHGTQPTQASQCNVIEEFESSGEMDESTAKNQEQSQMQSTAMKLLTQDNTWFLNVNTQMINGSNACPTMVQPLPKTSKQPITPLPPVNNISIPQPVTANPTEKSIASHLRQDFTFQYLHYVNIEKVESKLLMIAGEQNLSTNLHLKYQCNGGSRIVVNCESLKYILNITENEWKAVNHVLSRIGDYAFNWNSPPSHKSCLHRLIFYLFKTTSHFSKVHIAYNERDFETARVFYKTYVIDDVDVTPALDSQFLELLKDFAKTKKVQDQI